MLIERFRGCRGPKAVHPDKGALLSNIAFPAEGYSCLDRDPDRSDAQRLGAVALVLRVELAQPSLGYPHIPAYAVIRGPPASVRDPLHTGRRLQADLRTDTEMFQDGREFMKCLADRWMVS